MTRPYWIPPPKRGEITPPSDPSDQVLRPSATLRDPARLRRPGRGPCLQRLSDRNVRTRHQGYRTRKVERSGSDPPLLVGGQDRYLPDKAIDLLDETGARVQLRRGAARVWSPRLGEERERERDPKAVRLWGQKERGVCVCVCELSFFREGGGFWIRKK